MAAPRLGRYGFWHQFTTYPRTIPRLRPSFQPLRQRRFASYQNFPGRGGPYQNQYNSRFRGINRLHYVWDHHKPLIATVGAGGGVVYVYNLELVPITGRRRFNIVSPEFEKRIMEGGYPQMLQELQGKVLPPEHPYTRMVANVVERLLPSVKELAGNEWRVHVVDDPKQKNAFVTPGGKVFVFTGLLPICRDEEGLAVVLGHEIAHNVAHHAAERLSQSAFLLPFILAASMFFDVSSGTVQFFSDLIFSLPNSRTHEAEADHIGLLMMAQSCYNPDAAIPFWERMKEAQKGAPPQFLSTHPSDYSRIRAITEWLPEAKDKYHVSECGLTSGYARKFNEAFDGKGARKQPVVFQPPRQPQQGDDYFW